MPSGWDIYYIVFLAGFLALGIPALLAGLSFILTLGRRQRKKDSDFRQSLGAGAENGPALLGHRINTRFFLPVNVAIVLICLMLSLIPSAISLRPGLHPGMVARSLIAIVTVGAIALIGLLYAAKKGDLSWLRTFDASKSLKPEKTTKKDH